MRKVRALTGVIAAAALMLSACNDSGSSGTRGGESESAQPSVVVATDLATQSVTGDAAEQSLASSQALFTSADSVVVAAGDEAAMLRAASIGRALGVPTLIQTGDGTDVLSEVERLGATSVLLVGDPALPETDGVRTYRAPANAAELSSASGLDLTGVPAPSESSVSALAELEASQVIESPAGDSEASDGPAFAGKGDIEADGPASNGPLALIEESAASIAAAANAMAAGSTVRVVDGDFRASSDAIAQVKQADAVLGVGEELPETEDFAWQVEVAKSGQELPGGGQLMFSNKRYVALYGTPVTHTLGVLGEQGTTETIDRAAALAAEYQELTDDTVIPALEIIVTVASGKAGDDGNYSNEWDVSHFTPLIEAAQEAGQYVVIDFQPGRADFLTQVKLYEELLKYPHVGIALDPEWRLGPDERPLTRIGHVEIDEVNQVIDYLAEFTKENKLPQKMVILHQFQIQMLRDREQVETSHPEVAVLIHADGQGTQPQKNDTWRALLKDAPEGVHWGWKNFIDEDHPMLTPEQTYQIEPQPDFVSYQ